MNKARLTLLLDAQLKRAFEELCSSHDLTASQVLRQLIGQFMARHTELAEDRAETGLEILRART